MIWLSAINSKKFVVSKDAIALFLFVAFYTMPFLQWFFGIAFFFFESKTISFWMVLALIYLPTFFLILSSKKYFVVDFFLLWISIVLFFGITYIVHDEYEYVYRREFYGVFDYVFRPDNGLYAYLFIRLVNNPKSLLSGLRISGFIMYFYSSLKLYLALNRGYWLEENYMGNAIQLSYNLNFGYDLLLFVCSFLYCALRYKKTIDVVMFVVGFLMILLGGSRGPVLDIAIFGMIYILITVGESKYKLFYLFLVFLALLIVMFSYHYMLTAIMDLLSSFNISSRTLTKLLEGSVSEDNGRSILWAAATNMIEMDPWGYGAMGARHILYKIHIVGHPHNFILELFVEYGILGGSIILLYLLINSIRIFIKKDIGEWKGVFLIFFANSCQLLTSYTYWHSIGLWSTLAVGVCVFENFKKHKV